MSLQEKVDFIEAFKKRTKRFLVDTIGLYRELPKTEEARIIGRQLLRSSSSAGTNYRVACRGRSKAEFFAKMSIVVEEMDESVYWMEILIEAQIISEQKIQNLLKEVNEILAVVAAARKTASIKR